VASHLARLYERRKMSLLSLRGLGIRFGGIDALDDVSLEQEEGEILSLIGPNGAGKTTVFNCITRVYEPDRGAIAFDGRDLLAMRAHEVIGAGIARTFQNIELFGSMTVLENVLVGAHAQMHSNIIENAFRLPRAVREEREAQRRANAMLDFARLQPFRNIRAAGLPFGVKKRVELARALVSRPRLLLLDEPANGLSGSEIDDVMSLVRAVRDDLNVTILMVEHHMDLVMGVSDQVCVLDFGRKIAQGTPDEVRKDAAVIEAYLGEPVA
jgi:branched-chain amino acid transport system ATP-binding protein